MSTPRIWGAIGLVTATLLTVGAAMADGTQTWIGTWRPVTIEGREVPRDGGNPEITFATDGSISGSLGCNRMGGRWSGTATALAFSNIMSTRMACMGPAMDVELRFSALLDKPWRVERTPNGLTVWTAAGQSTFVKVR